MSNKRRSKPPLLPEFKTTDPFVPKLVKKPTPTDAALIAGRILLMRALESAGTTPSAAGADGLVVHVGVSDQTWADVLRDSWRDSIRNGGRCYESAFDRYSDGEDTWVAWLPEVAPKPFVLREGNESFTRSLAKGIHCVGFAADATWLPQDLVQTADLHIVIPTLLGRDVAAIAEELCGHEATVLISNGEACILRPRHLRLARRPVQTADEYVLKLRGLIESEKVRTQTAKTASPRDQPDLSRLHGMDEVVAWGHAVQRDLQGIAAGSLTWSDVDRGCLISGPPGVGKTLFARGLAATLGIPLVVGSYSQWHGTGNSHQGDLLRI